MFAAVPLHYVVAGALSAFAMLERMGTNTNISYQTGGPNPCDLPNRDGELETIRALAYLGIHHIRNQGLDADPAENQFTAYPHAPSDYQNFLTIRRAIPSLKIDYLIDAGGPPHWNDGTVTDPVPVLRDLAQLGALAALEGPNEPNNQTTYSPVGILYPQSVSAYNAIWTQWGAAMRELKRANAAMSDVPLLPSTSAVQGADYPDGVEATYEQSKLTDHRAYFDLMNIHSYPAFAGISLGDPQGSIAGGNPPNWGAYQISIPNWGRYAMPGRRTVVTESGANSILSGGDGPKVSERAQGLALINDYFWAAYYGAVRLYQYQLNDDSSDLADPNADRWGFFRGNWTAKPGALYVHNFTRVLADSKESDPAAIPPFTVLGKRAAGWGATMAFSKSDGSYVIACDNTLAWWNLATGADLTPQPEMWTVRFARSSSFTVTDVMSGVTTPRRTASSVTLPVRGYPMLIAVAPPLARLPR
jgi:hypothetical protein